MDSQGNVPNEEYVPQEVAADDRGGLLIDAASVSPLNVDTAVAGKDVSDGPFRKPSLFHRYRYWLLGIITVLALGGGLFVATRDRSPVITRAGNFKAISISLKPFETAVVSQGRQTATIDGRLQVNRSLVLSPSEKPPVPVTGEMYYDTNTNQLTYYNGTTFVGVASGVQILQSTTNLGDTTNIFNSAGNTVAGVTGSGTANTLAKFTGVQQVGDSIASDKGTYLELRGGLNLVPETTLSDFRLWPNTAVPTNPNYVDLGGSDELGVKFRVDGAGSVKGVRFYRGTSSVGPYIGSLWSGTGTLLAQKTFAISGFGWQEILFDAPVAISPDTTYVASYHQNGGGYAADGAYFSSGGIDSGPLHALASGVDGGNGVFRYSATSAFPNISFNSSNYWADVVFTGTTFTDSSRIRVNGAQLSTNDLANNPDIAKRGSAQVFSGHNIFRNASDSDDAFSIQRADTTQLLGIDTQNLRVTIGPESGSGTGVLLVLNNKTGTAEDPPGVNGAMYYNVALRTFRCYRDNEWKDCAALTAPSGFSLYEEFMGGFTSSFASPIGNLGWAAQAIGANGSLSFNPLTPAPVSDRPGVLRVQTPAVANQGTTFTLADTSAASMLIGAGNSVRTAVALGSATGQVLRVGLHTETTATTRPISGVWWEADPANSANWQYCYGNGTVGSCADSTVPIAANTWVRLEIRIVATGTNTSSVSYIINGAVIPIVSNVTVDTTNRVSPAYSCFGTDGTARNCYWDYFQLLGSASALR